VVLAYADDSAFQTVLGIYSATTKRLARHFEFLDSWWRFGSFANPGQLEEAAQHAAAADIIFCCPGNQCELPPAVRDWIGLWTSQRNEQDGALAALLPAATLNTSSPSPVRTYLEEVARANSLAFFFREYVAHLTHYSPPRADEPRQPYGEDLVACHIETKPEVRHWGINE
jgi:hypothetical protein